MAIEYTHTNLEGNFQIFRDKEHVATYDPVSEETKWVKDEFSRFANHVTREISAIIAGNKPAPDEPAPDEPAPDEPTMIKSLQRRINEMEKMIAEQMEKITHLEGELSNTVEGIDEPIEPTPFSSDRFSDKVDLTGAPPQDPSKGDLTPLFIEWARDNMPPAIFTKRYHGRIQGA